MSRHFDDQGNMALFTGKVIGLLMRALSEGQFAGFLRFEPVIDEDGDYTRDIICHRKDGQVWKLTVSDLEQEARHANAELDTLALLDELQSDP